MIKNCEVCKKEFSAKPYHIKKGQGRFCSMLCRDVWQRTKIGENSAPWKGNMVGYHGIHKWVYYYKGRPNKCEFCGRKRDKPRTIVWANKSGEYLRDLSDWLSLCVPCHMRYDRENNLIGNGRLSSSEKIKLLENF